MKVLRIVVNVGTSSVKDAERFYRDFLGLEAVMDLGWIATYASDEVMKPQISFASAGGSGPLFRTYRLRSMILNKHSSVQSASVFRLSMVRLLSRGASEDSTFVIPFRDW
jgi:hypothetical protein